MTTGAIASTAHWSGIPSALARTTGPGGSPRLGDDRAAFEQLFGEGADLDSGLIRYAANDGEAIYAVRFTDGIADQVEVDLAGLPGGGPEQEDADIGTSRFLPDDADEVASLSTSMVQRHSDTYVVTIHASAELAESTGRSGNVMVFDKRTALNSPAQSEYRSTAATVAMETFDVHEVVPAGEQAVIGGPVEDWEFIFGPTTDDWQAERFEESPIGYLVFGTSGVSGSGELIDIGRVMDVDIRLDDPVPAQEAIAFVGSVLPPDATLDYTFATVPTEWELVTRRIQVWSLPAQQRRALVIIALDGTEASGDVVRIGLSAGEAD